MKSLLAGVIFFSAAFVHGLAGFAFALLAVPLLSLFWPLKQIVPLMALLGGTINGLLLLSLRRHFRWQRVLTLFLGALPGVWAGATLLSKAPEGVLKLILAVTLIGYGAWGFFNPSPKLKLGEAWGYFFGFLAGALGAALNTPGPPVVIYVTLKGWSKDEVKSTLQGYFFILAFLIIAAHALKGLLKVQTFISYFEFLPAVLLGLFLGHALYYRLSFKTYLRILYLVLILAGLLALYR